ncbi:MAG: phosphoenolpyruvate-utilizing N-terminal domain-containing protein [Waltera sp.]
MARSVFIKKDEQRVKRTKIADPRRRRKRVMRQARQTAMEQLRNLYQKALKEVGEANAAIFEIHQMMLEDDDYNGSMHVTSFICSRSMQSMQ